MTKTALWAAYLAAIVLGTLPYVVLNSREHQYDGVNMLCGVLSVPSAPLGALVAITGALMFGMDFNTVTRVTLYLVPPYLALLYWPLPVWALAPSRASQTGMRTIMTTYLVLVLAYMVVGTFVMVMVVNSPR